MARLLAANARRTLASVAAVSAASGSQRLATQKQESKPVHCDFDAKALGLATLGGALLGAGACWYQMNGKAEPLKAQACGMSSQKRVPKRLVIVRHGESEGNVDKEIYRTVADNALHLTDSGWQQALSAGRILKQVIGDEKVRFFVSPYVRTRETFHGIARAWGGHHKVRWSEDPRIREQDFGNFQDTVLKKEQKKESHQFGSFYYRFADGGESSADVYDRVSSFLESLYRHWEEHPKIDNYVIVCHGLTAAVFLMRWSKYSIDEFNEYENFVNCEFAVLEKDEAGRLTFKYCVRSESGELKQLERARKPENKVKRRQMRYE